MVSNSQGESPTDRLKRATSIVLRALAQDMDSQPVFGTAVSLHRPERVLLPNPPKEEKEQETTLADAFNDSYKPEDTSGSAAADMEQFRGLADRSAFWQRHHDDSITAPEAISAATDYYNRLERVRTEMLGSWYLRGSAMQLAHCGALDAEKELIETPPDELAPTCLGEILRAAVELTSSRHDNTVPQLWPRLQSLHPATWVLVKQTAERIAGCLDDQKRFAELSLELLRDLGIIAPSDSQGEDAEDSTEADEDSQDSAHEGEDYGDEQENLGEEDGEDKQEMAEGTMEVPMPEELEAQLDEDDENAEAEGQASELNAMAAQSTSDYKAFTTAFDSITSARDLCPDPVERAALRLQLDRAIQPALAGVSRLTRKLQHIIMARRKTSWQFDLEEGWLNTARLARVVTSPGTPLSYKIEKQHEHRDTVVSLLIDNSGSMRGNSIALAACAAEVVATTLERCGITTEILGFTTSQWKGGQTRKAWETARRPTEPGRLNDLLHIVYKSAGESWLAARSNMGVMLRDGLLKENIDGEALLWAHERLMHRIEERRILIVISDGAPVDDSTLSSNASDYLNKHLTEVVQKLEQRSPIELRAIGIGHDVARYYSRALTLHRADQLGGALIDELCELFRRAPKKKPLGKIRKISYRA